MRYSVMAPTETGRAADPEWIAAFARHAETCGFESIVAVEHAVVMSQYSSEYPYDSSGRMELADDCPIPDPLNLLAYLAGCTETLGLATGVLILPNHHPVPLAKRLATLDRLSGGRLRVCAGVGWMREEIEACGTDFATRGRRTDEAIDVLRALWAESGPEGATHDGEFFGFSGAMSYPKPVRPSGVPIHIGGHSKAAARRAGRRGDGFQPLGLHGDALQALVTEMRRAAEDAGRDPHAIELTLGHAVMKIDPARAAKLESAGASRIVLAGSGATALQQQCDELSACAERLGLTGPRPGPAASGAATAGDAR
ncbi:LLM class F420-dependent oxidoreductase [Tomitella fengzijianii]|uniref:LLM class F420-dependent oxidoreductase n=1 Tax=Tomitella fengzijianii TaxID=2597660 RepID=A0A516X700_9ACTN|nr:LLM class F420-dependent oxidoreductase [Tomitella fengzijianii]QDQ98844.1 LLM class F420-dependent oxidoreductase [Tomitella fengzijianii]